MQLGNLAISSQKKKKKKIYIYIYIYIFQRDDITCPHLFIRNSLSTLRMRTFDSYKKKKNANIIAMQLGNIDISSPQKKEKKR